MTLYNLTSQYIELMGIMDDPDISEDVILDTMACLTGEIEDKAESYAIVIKELESEAEKLKKEEERLYKIRKTIDGNIKRMKANLFFAMEQIGVKKLASKHFKFSIAKNGGKAPLEFFDEIPQDYQVAKWSPDTEKIRQALDDGKELPFVKYGEKGSHLNIR